MNELLIKGSKIKYDQEIYELDDMFTSQLFEKCNGMANEYNKDICIVNEVFINRVQPYQAIELFFNGLGIELIKLENPDKELIPLILDFAKKNKIRVEGSPFLYKLTSKLYGQISLVLTLFYLSWKMMLIPYASDLKLKKDKISLIRTSAASKKLSYLEDIEFKYENINDKNSIYNCFKKRKRLLWVIKSFITSCKELKIYKEYINECIGSYSAYNAYKYYSIRIVHTLLYSIVIDKFLKDNQDKKFYTGNNLDRFALIEERIAKKNNIEIICIPHGIEYGFKLPHCFIGTIFYTTSSNAEIYLNELYGTNKFLYDQNIAYQMFAVKNMKLKERKEIVFFTEPREIEVNFKIIEKLIQFLNSKELNLVLKLHPKDRKSNYKKYIGDIRFLEDFNKSIMGNICISRKSTILLEAVHNASIAAAILTNSKDKAIFNNFPSLQDERIEVFYSIDKLCRWILEKTKE